VQGLPWPITGINKKLGPGIDTRCSAAMLVTLGHTERHRQAGPSRVAERHPDRGPSRACPSEATARPVPGLEEERPRQLLVKVRDTHVVVFKRADKSWGAGECNETATRI